MQTIQVEVKRQEEEEDVVNAELKKERARTGVYLYSRNKEVNEGLRNFFETLRQEYGTSNKADAIYIELTRLGKLKHVGTLKW